MRFFFWCVFASVIEKIRRREREKIRDLSVSSFLSKGKRTLYAQQYLHPSNVVDKAVEVRLMCNEKNAKRAR